MFIQQELISHALKALEHVGELAFPCATIRCMNSTPPLAREAKEVALAQVEASETFSKQGQLRSILRFICESEISGRGAELHEYLIGTEVLGQKAGYNTSENSIVRSRVFALRHKLLEFYATEGATAEVRIDIPKGSYCPRFLPGATPPTLPPPALSDALPSPHPVPLPFDLPRHIGWRAVGAALLVACLLSGLIGYHFASIKTQQAIAPVIREVWGPLLSPSASAIICVASSPELLVRSAPEGTVQGMPVPAEMGLDSWYKQRSTMRSGEHLYAVPNFNSAIWGDASGAISISEVLTRAGSSAQVLPERVIESFALKDRNVILFGRPENSPAAALFLQGLYYTIRWSRAAQDLAVSYTDPGSGVVKELVPQQNAVQGLITVIRSSSAERGSTQMVIFSGVNSAGTIAAADFFASPDHMREFKTRLQKDGYKSFPMVYQIVVSTEANKWLPYKSSMETYKFIS